MDAYSSIFTYPRSFYCCTSYRDYRDAPFLSGIVRAYYSPTSSVYSSSSSWSDLDCSSIDYSYRGSNYSELRIRWWCQLVLACSSYFSARLIRCSPADRPLGFGVWRQRGRGIEYDRFRGSDVFRGSLVILLAYILHLEFLCVIHYYAFIVCLLSCIELYICDSDIYVTVIYDMCALYFELFICHITCVMLICLCFRVLLRCKWALLLVLMLISYLLSTSCWLGSYKLD